MARKFYRYREKGGAPSRQESTGNLGAFLSNSRTLHDKGVGKNQKVSSGAFKTEIRVYYSTSMAVVRLLVFPAVSPTSNSSV
jgi:hypothetical protein